MKKLSKKKLLIFAALSLALLITAVWAGVYLGVTVKGARSSDIWGASDAFDPDDFASFEKADGENFKILQLTDIQLSGFESEVKACFALITRLIKDTEPDLLVLTGDSVALRNNHKKGARLTGFLDGFGIPYAITMGNHDGEGHYDIEKMAELYASGEYSLFRKGPGNIQGVGNYGVNITSGGEIVYSLFFLDSNRYRKYDGKRGYDYIYSNQADYYEWYINGVNSFTEKSVKNMLFYHIPVPEIDGIRAEIKEKYPAAVEKFAFREDPCPPKENSGFFDRVTELGAATHMFFGHDHVNLLSYEYRGVRFVYGLKTGPCSYYDKDRQGGTLITLRDNLEVTVDFMY